MALVTAPDVKSARRLAGFALRARLAACVNIISKIESHYWWQGKLDRGTEVLLLFKTRATRLKALEREILAKHPYDTPEFIVLKITGGSRRYLDWLKNSVG